MSVILIEPDPISRGHLHFLASIAGLDYMIAAHPLEALARIDPLPHFQQGCEPTPILIVTEVQTPRMGGVEFARTMRERLPHVTLFATCKSHAKNDIPEGVFDAIFIKPAGLEDVVRSALGVVGTYEDACVFGSMIPGAA